MMSLSIKRAIVVFIALHLLGCSGNRPYAPVVERQAVVTRIPDTHRVVYGDTLYSIAWRYGVDYKQLAKINGIGSPYLIKIGEQIKLKAVSGSPHQNNKTAPAARHTRQTKSPERPVASATGRKEQSRPVPKVSDDWYWPAKGPLLNAYSKTGKINKGIDIGGKLGDAVYSTQAGTVVYAGNGLVGYGNLVIIKHNARYLSAYAHNSRILVSEGQRVRAGMKVAEMGSSGTSRPMLHFEIRREGKPVDPMVLLPLRR